MKFLKKFRLRRAKLTPDASLEDFRRRQASFVFSTYDCKNAVPAAACDTSASKTFGDASILNSRFIRKSHSGQEPKVRLRCLQTGDMVSKRLYKHGSCTMHVLQYLVETSLCQGLLNVERCTGAVQKWRHWGREGGKISRSRLLLFKNANSIDFSVTVIFEFPLQAGWLGPYEDVTVGEYFQRLIAWNVLRWRAIYWRIMITIDPLVCFSNMIVRSLADPYLPLNF